MRNISDLVGFNQRAKLTSLTFSVRVLGPVYLDFPPQAQICF